MTTRVQNFNAISAGAVTSLSKTLGTAVSVGDLIVLGVLYGDNGTTASINDATLGANKDSLGNTYSVAPAAASNANPLDYTTDGDLLYVFYSIATNAGTPTIRVLASSGSHNIKLVGETVTPTNTFSLDQNVTSHYNSTPGGTLTSGAQTPTTAAGYAFDVFAGIGSLSLFTAGTGFTARDETSDGWVEFQDAIYASTTTLTGSATSTASTENGGILALFKDASGGATSKTDTDTATVSETAAVLTNKTTGTPDTATLTEQAPQIALSAQPDSFTLSETQTVTVGGVTSKTDTDTATLAEAAAGPHVGVIESATLTESALTLVVTDVQAVPDFTVTEQTPQIGVSQADSLTFSEQQTLTASFIRWVDTDAFGLAEATPRIDLSLTEALSLTERVPALSQNQTDTAGLTDAQAVSALLRDLDTGTFLESQTVTVIGGFTGYAKGLLTVQDRLGGVLTSSARLSGTLTGADRLQGTLTIAPVGPP